MQPVRIAQNDPLPASLDQSLLLPRAENPADGVQRRPRHLGTSCRLIGKSISTPASTFLPACLARRSSACATRCSTCSFDISSTRACVSCRRLPTVCNALEARLGYFAIRRFQEDEGQPSATLSTAATAVAG